MRDQRSMKAFLALERSTYLRELLKAQKLPYVHFLASPPPFKLRSPVMVPFDPRLCWSN